MSQILALTAALTAALVLGFVAQRLRLSPIVGYLAAGIVVGPFTPGLVIQHELAGGLAEVGIVLLLFGAGLSFHVEELLAVRRIAVPGAITGVAVATALGAAAARALGWPLAQAIVFGLAISIAST